MNVAIPRTAMAALGLQHPPSILPCPDHRRRTVKTSESQAPFAAMLACMLAAAWSTPAQAAPAAGAAAPAAADCTPTRFRVRSGVLAPLDADDDWAAPEGSAAVVMADRPFRIRFEVEAGPGDGRARYPGLEYRRNGGAWMDVEPGDFPYPAHQTPAVASVSTPAFGNGAATTDLLRGSSTPFGGGAGVALDESAPAWRGQGVHGEWEWALVVRAFADGPVQHVDGDRFEFRMTGLTDCPADAGRHATVTLQVPAGHIGGTFVETPGPIGPWQAANGDLYFIMEPAETHNVLMMLRSSDGGRSWREADGANRPLADDLEGVASALHAGTVHILHQTSDDVWHHAFRTSDHPVQPDTWAVRDERLASPVEPPTQVAALAARSNGSLVAVYGAGDRLGLRIRSAAGTWGDEQPVDAEAGHVVSGPMLATGRNDVVHLAYTVGDGSAWYRQVLPDGRLGHRLQLASGLPSGSDDAVGAILPLVWLPGSDTIVVVYRLANGELWSRRASAGGAFTAPARVSDRHVVQGAIDSDQAGADAVAVGEAVHVLFIETSSGRLYHAASDADGRWSPDALVLDGVNAQWVRGRAVRRADGRVVYGHVVDAGSDGGSGFNRYGEVEVEAPPRR